MKQSKRIFKVKFKRIFTVNSQSKRIFTIISFIILPLNNIDLYINKSYINATLRGIIKVDYPITLTLIKVVYL